MRQSALPKDPSTVSSDLPRVAIYVIPFLPEPDDHIAYAIAALQKLVGRCVVVCPEGFAATARALLAGRTDDTVLVQARPKAGISAGYRQALIWFWAQNLDPTDVIVTGSHVIGPLLPLDPRALNPSEAGAAMFSAYWFNPALDIRFSRRAEIGLVPSLDFAVFSASLMQNPAFRAFWRGFKSRGDHRDGVEWLNFSLAAMLRAEGLKVAFPLPPAALETYEPALSEIHKLIAADAPCLPLSVLRLDPVLHDLYSIDLRIALDDLRARHPQIYRLVIGYVSHNLPPRDFAMISDLYEVLPLSAADPHKTDWEFGRIAVFIHAYYAEMMPEFWILLQRIPCAFDVFITTSNAANRDQIDEFLDGQGVAPSAREVVVVAQNRGRDMSSLFITFRELALSGKYKVALRLHSKRTPQVSRQVGENFKKHLFENLVASRGYISNILDRFEQEPDIGMIMPPVVHIGFGTLGHSWFNNFKPLLSIAKDMNLRINYDRDTPLAPLGTMYWFRPDALHKMFDHPWAWEDYNPEPRHIDGGLAHVQERLICYVCIDRGYRVLMAMTPAQAGRNYAKLEYKLQLLASRLASGNVQIQRDQLDQLRNSFRALLLRKLMEIYGKIVRRFPGARSTLRPIGHVIRRILHPWI